MASGDPRLSIEERYPSFSVYQATVKKRGRRHGRRRLMLREDAGPAVNRLLRAGEATGAIAMDAASK